MSDLVRLLPEPIRASLRETPVETAYRHVRKLGLELEPLEVEAPVGSVRLLTPPGEIIREIVSEHGVYEPVLTRRLCKVFDAGTVFYDIGSRYGYYSVLASKCGVPEKGIHCFEPDIENFHVLRRNHRNENVQLNRTRVTNAPAKGAVSADSYLEAHRPPSHVKIDIEGAEYDALRGMCDCLQQHAPKVYVEMHPHRLPDFDASPRMVFDLLERVGYEIRVEPDHRSERRSWSSVTDADLPTDRPYLLWGRPQNE